MVKKKSTASISVIIPTFNRARYLPEALDSVLNQKNHVYELEVIVIDDKSTDDTVKLLEKKYKDKITLIKLPKNTGRPAMVRNAGMKVAKGEFIAFQDSDDIWTNDKLAKQMVAFDDPDVVLSYGNCGYITAEGEYILDKYGVATRPAMEGYSFIRKVSRQASPSPTPTVVIRRSVIDKIGLFNEKLVIATDTDYWIRVATLGKFAYCDQVLAYMRRDGSNISSRPDESGDEAIYKHEMNRIDMFKHILEEVELTDEEKQALRYRIAEIQLEVAIAARMLGGRPLPFKVSDINLPKQPKALADINRQYGQKIITPIKETLLKVLGRYPAVYVNVFVLLKRLTRPFRSS